VLIFVHELGHFIAAKAVGVGVPRFSLGLGPVTPLRWRKGETDYVISWIPFGGYVKMATAEEGEEGGLGSLEGGRSEETFPPEKLFENKPLWARILVIIAGVTMNALLAWLIYTIIAAAYGKEELPITTVARVDTTALPEGARGLASLPFGAQIVRINGDTVRSWNDIAEAFAARSDTLHFEFAGQLPPVTVRIPGIDFRQRIAARDALRPLLQPKIGVVLPGRPAAKAGVAAGDLVIRANQDTVPDWEGFVRAIERRAGDTVTLAVARGETVVQIPVVPAPEEVKDELTGETRTVGRIGVGPDPPRRYVRYGLGRAIVEGGRQTARTAGMVWFTLKGFVIGQVSPRDLGGVIMIGQLSGQAVRRGLVEFIGFIALFSVNLAVLNLLPIPVLDGGHLLFLLIEGVRRRPLSLNVRLRLSQVGLVLLIGLMLFALTNDLMRVLGQ
jgi:regulator of sigma E protease